jgi:hypothetical protein
MQSIQPQVIKHLFALFVATFSSISMAQTAQIIPEAPRYLEPVYARIPERGSIRAFMRLGYDGRHSTYRTVSADD